MNPAEARIDNAGSLLAVPVQCFDGRSAKGRAATLRQGPKGLRLHFAAEGDEGGGEEGPGERAEDGEGEGRAGWAVESWTFFEEERDGYFRLQLRSGSQSWTAEGTCPGLRARLLPGGFSSSVFGRLLRAKTGILFWLFIAVAAGASLYFFGLPLAVETAMKGLPRTWDEKIGRQVFQQYFAEDTVQGGEAAAALRGGQAFLDSLGAESGLTLRLHFSRKAGTVNAFALPSGDILLYQGLVRKMEGPEELLGVLAHEAGHVSLRHGMKHLMRTALLGLFFGLAFGDVSGLGSVLVDNASALTTLSYGRSDESAADSFALAALARKGLDCGALERFFSRDLGKELPAWMGFLSTHPSDEKRMERLRHQRRGEAGCADAPYPAPSDRKPDPKPENPDREEPVREPGLKRALPGTGFLSQEEFQKLRQ